VAGEATTDQRIVELGLTLPAEPKLPPGVTIPFSWVRTYGDRVFVSGHGPLAHDGSPRGPFGRVPDEVSLEKAQTSARETALAMFAALKRAIGSLDAVKAWLTVDGYVNASPGYAQTTAVLNPFSELLLDVFGAERGAHARTAIGVVALPLNLPVVIRAQLAI
jgi:enamine deaminase RidA (YjgF/YER057c/UK114 family)